MKKIMIILWIILAVFWLIAAAMSLVAIVRSHRKGLPPNFVAVMVMLFANLCMSLCSLTAKLIG